VTFYVATYDELNNGFAHEVARIGAKYGASGYLQLGRGVHTVDRTDIECLKFADLQAASNSFPAHQIVALETSGVPLSKYAHVQDAIYILGSRLGTLSEDVLSAADDVVRIEGPVIPTDVAAGIVLYHRSVTL
jgi:hypothetical protein